MQDNLPKIVAGVCGVALLFGTVFWMMPSKVAAISSENVTYVCTETGKVIVAPAQSQPALNPETGKHTLLRGVFCPQCNKWYATPSPDHLRGNPRELKCQVHNVPMTYDGPVPQ